MVKNLLLSICSFAYVVSDPLYVFKEHLMLQNFGKSLSPNHFEIGSLDEKIIANVVERCDYQPMYIQQFLFDLWRSDIINLAVVEDIEKSINSSLKNQFIVLWNLLTQNQKKALRLVADSGGKGIYTAELLQRVGFNSASVLQRALSALIEKEILYKNDTYQFQDAMLRKWIQRFS
jgi:hypothetical protein